MTKQMIDPSFKALVEKMIERRDAALAQLKPGQSILTVTVKKSGKKLMAVYKRHDRITITLESARQTIDWLFRGGTLNLGGDFSTTEEITFNFIDVDIKQG